MENEENGTPAPNAPAGETTNTPGADNPTPPVEPPATPPVEPPAAPVVPEGYVKAEDVDAERTARTAAEAARVEAETRATAAEARARSTEIKAAASALGFNDPADAEAFLASDATDIEAALKEVLEKKPYLAKSAEAAPPVVTPTSPTNPARTETLTLEAVKGMTKEQIAANWEAVKGVLAQNR